MDIAVGGIIILIILLPGICFNRGYYSGAFSNEFTKNDFFSVLVSSLIPSLVIYLLGYLTISIFSNYYYDFKILLGLFSSEEIIYTYSIANIELFKVEIILYNSVINIISFFSGRIVKGLIIKNNLDTKYRFLRYKNYWYYLISGRFINFPESSIQLYENKVEDVDITYLDALVSINDITYIYTGILVDYSLGNDGGLDLLIIKDAQRKRVSNEDNSSYSYKDISGHIIALKYCDLINVNLSFIQVNISESTNDENENSIILKFIT